MGTNYYLEGKKPCPHCGRGYADLHIGKSSGGWTFALHVYPENGINTLEDWKPLLRGGKIKDEYGRDVTFTDMLATITKRSHPQGLKRDTIDGDRCVGHGDGTYDYCTGDFS